MVSTRRITTVRCDTESESDSVDLLSITHHASSLGTRSTVLSTTIYAHASGTSTSLLIV